MDNTFRPFSRDQLTGVRRRHLPHWEQRGGSYFLTFRTADSLPADKLSLLEKEKKRWMRCHPQPWTPDIQLEYSRNIFRHLDRWLDCGYGDCPLSTPSVAQVVADALHYYDGQRYCLDEFTVMPNHCHVMALVLEGFQLEQILHSWKSYTANRINRLLDRKGRLWLGESFDRVIRDRAELEKFRQYIRQNPARAGLSTGQFLIGKGTGIKP